MALYVDSADRAAVESLLTTGAFRGITTNPTILARAGLPQDAGPAVYAWATAAGAQEVFLQAKGESANEIAAYGRSLGAVGARAVIKVPASREGIEAVARLKQEGYRTLVTAVYHPAQALLAAAAEADFIAPYVGRMTDQGRDGVASTVAMVETLDGSSVRVLAASLRTVDDLAALSRAGVHDFAIGAPLCESLLADPLTVEAAATFELEGVDASV